MARPPRIQSRFRGVDRETRQQFIAEQRAGVASIVAQYVGAVENANEFLRSNPRAFTPKNALKVANEYDQLLLNSESRIAGEFSTEFTRLARIAGQSTAIPLEFSGRTPPELEEFYSNFTVNMMRKRRFADNLPLSERIWSKDQRVNLLSDLVTGIRNGEAPSKIADTLSKNATSGSTFNQAYRLAFTETQRAYATAKVDSVRAWNSSPQSDFKIVILQKLSPTHVIRDVCDLLVGYYDPDDLIPEIPRHPNCVCIQRQEILTPALARKLSSVNEKLSVLNREVNTLGVNQVQGIFKSYDGDVSYLRSIGVFVDSAGSVDGQVVGRSTNKYNEMMEKISRISNKEEQRKAAQALYNITPEGDPLGGTVRNTLSAIYGVSSSASGALT